MHSVDIALEYRSTSFLEGLQNALQDVPISLGRCGASCSQALAEEEISLTIQVLDYGSQRLSTSEKFIRGDFWNSLPKKYGNRIGMLRGIYPKKSKQEILCLYRAWKECGMVAKRWPFLKRSVKVSWRWYRDHFPTEESMRTEYKEESADTISNGMAAHTIRLEGQHKGAEMVLYCQMEETLRIHPDPTAITITIDLSHLHRDSNAALEEEDSEGDTFAEMQA